MTSSGQERSSKRQGRYEKVKQLQAQGHGVRAIARHLGITRNTVKRYWHQNKFVPRQTSKRSNLLLYEGYGSGHPVTSALAGSGRHAGQTNVKELLEEIKAFGYTGSYTTLTEFLVSYPRLEVEPVLPPARKASSYSNRRICRLLNQSAVNWSADEERFLTHLLAENSLIRTVHELSQRFRQHMQAKSAEGLASWCAEAEGVIAYSGFVRGLRQDYCAVEQASSRLGVMGRRMGQVNRLKMLKRQGYGRARFDLLRRRVLFRNLHSSPKVNQNPSPYRICISVSYTTIKGIQSTRLSNSCFGSLR